MKSNLSRPEILATFSEIVAKSLHIDLATITPASFLNDLGAESLDLIEITMETEEAFNLWISEKSILQTASEVFGPNVLEKDGVLTDAGKALLMDRMPDLDTAALEGDVSVTDITRQFLRVDAWVRMIEGLLYQTPQSCPQCDAPLANAIAFKMKCKQCGTETPLPSGEELNKQWAIDFRERYFLSAPRAQAAAS
jgi:acyl carrier protein